MDEPAGSEHASVLLVRRYERHGATLGILTIPGHLTLQTLEPGWHENEPERSCIPVGSYICRRHMSPRFGVTFEIRSVPHRLDILFHAGNTIDDTRGCVLLGMSAGEFDHKPAVLGSRRALRRFMGAFEGRNQFDLIVSGV